MSKNSNKISYSSPDKTSQSPTNKKTKAKSITLYHKISSPELLNLSVYNMDMSPTLPGKTTFETLIEYLEGIVENIYKKDPLKMQDLITDFVVSHLPSIKQKVKERLSLTQYLNQSLRYKQFGEIDCEIQKEWKKNILMLSIGTIWSTRMQNYKFHSTEEFLAEYRKFWELVSNFTYFYFRSALSLLEQKFNVFSLIQEETAHTVIDNLPEWLHLYDSCLISLLMKKNMREQNQMNMEFPLETLEINSKYIDLHNSEEEQLKGTIEAIRNFSFEHTIAGKVEKLKTIRTVFLKEIEQSRQKQEIKLNVQHYSPLQKDDIIGCMIYSIVKGKIFKIQVSLQALSSLLGPQNQLLSRKGVDSYRADLESAVQYLVEQNEVSLITVPEELKQKLRGP